MAKSPGVIKVTVDISALNRMEQVAYQLCSVSMALEIERSFKLKGDPLIRYFATRQRRLRTELKEVQKHLFKEVKDGKAVG